MIKPPPPDADGYWHYTYVTYHPVTGEWYGGKHSTSKLEDGYLGSGNWVRTHPAREELVIEIVEFFYSEEHAYAAEAVLVDYRIIDRDPLCRNKADGGFGLSREAISRLEADPEYRRKKREAMAALAADPEWRRNNREMNERKASDPEWRRKNRAANVRKAADPEWQRKNREMVASRNADPEWRLKHREAMARLHKDPEWKKRNRAALALTYSNPERSRKLREMNARLGADPEWQKKRRETNARVMADPEWLRKVREGVVRRDANRLAKAFARFAPDGDADLDEVVIAGEEKLAAG